MLSDQIFDAPAVIINDYMYIIGGERALLGRRALPRYITCIQAINTKKNFRTEFEINMECPRSGSAAVTIEKTVYALLVVSMALTIYLFLICMTLYYVLGMFFRKCRHQGATFLFQFLSTILLLPVEQTILLTLLLQATEQTASISV